MYVWETPNKNSYKACESLNSTTTGKYFGRLDVQHEKEKLKKYG